MRTSFAVDLNLLVELGEQLISKDEVAVTELVKNSYDADASLVEVTVGEDFIRISDNGNGMDENDLKYGWLLVGTSVKKREKRTPLLGRRVLGEKGIGRLAVLRLGRSVELVSRKKKCEPYSLSLKFWPEQLETTDDIPIVPLDRLPILQDKLKEVPNFPDDKDTGTIITITDLIDGWGEKKLESLKTSLSKLIFPFGEEISDFSITLMVSGEDIHLSSPEVFRNPPYSIEAVVEDEGTYFATCNYNKQGQKEVLDYRGNFCDSTSVNWKGLEDGGPGGFKYRLNVWDLDEVPRGWRGDLREWAGVSLIKNKFLGVQPGEDWLGFNLRRVNSPTVHLSTNQIMGAIYIDSDKNPNLKDKTDRQGVLENTAFEILRDAIYELTHILEKERTKRRKENRLAKGNIFEKLDPTPLRDIAGKLKGEEANELKKYADEMSRIRAELEDLLLGRDRMATLGNLSAKLVHEGRNALLGVTDNFKLIEPYFDEIPETIKKAIERMVTSGKRLAILFNYLDPFVRFGKRPKERIDLKTILEILEELYQPELEESKITIQKEIEPELKFKANPTDFYILMANFIVNSIYWIQKAENNSSRNYMRIFARIENNSLVIEVEDNGPGISEADRNLVFETGYSTRTPAGTGLGLAINRDIVESYRGTISLTSQDGNPSAHFIIRFPLGEK